MRSEPRGMVLICNINFKGETKRRGSEFDVKNLNNLFLRLGYKVKITEDCSAAVRFLFFNYLNLIYKQNSIMNCNGICKSKINERTFT